MNAPQSTNDQDQRAAQLAKKKRFFLTLLAVLIGLQIIGLVEFARRIERVPKDENGQAVLPEHLKDLPNMEDPDGASANDAEKANANNTKGTPAQEAESESPNSNH